MAHTSVPYNPDICPLCYTMSCVFKDKAYIHMAYMCGDENHPSDKISEVLGITFNKIYVPKDFVKNVHADIFRSNKSFTIEETEWILTEVMENDYTDICQLTRAQQNLKEKTKYTSLHIIALMKELCLRAMPLFN